MNAIEIMNDGTGNENGLCESQEACLYTPNLGAYQGHGNLVELTGSAIGAGATMKSITLYKYETNGYN